mgnify:CR=1 FL=1
MESDALNVGLPHCNPLATSFRSETDYSDTPNDGTLECPL